MNTARHSIGVYLAPILMASVALCWGAGAQQVDPATYQRVVDENIELRQEQTRLMKENGELRRKNADLVLDIQDLDAKREQLAVLVAQLKTPDENKAELDRLRADRAALLAELDRMRKTVQVVVPVSTNPAPSVASPKEGSDLFQRIEQENADLRQQLAREREAMQASLKVNEGLRNRVAELQSGSEASAKSVAGLKRGLEEAGAREAALKKALEKMARQVYQQEQELARFKTESPKSPTRPVSASTVAPVDDVSGGPMAAAQKALNAKRFDEAERLYSEALKESPGDARLYYNLGVLYSDYLNDPRKGAKYFRKYLELSPKARDAAQVRAWILDLESRAKW